MSLTVEQVKERVNYLGGSDIAALLGLSRWKTPLMLWSEKVGIIEPEDISDKLQVKLGNKMEQIVGELYCEETGNKVRRVNETIVDKTYPFLAANIDRRVEGKNTILEIKTVSGWRSREFEQDEMPAEFILQVLHYLGVTGAERGELAVLIGNSDFRIRTVERDEKLISDIRKKAVEFWTQYVKPRVMPKVIKRGDTETLYKIFPEANHDSIALGDDANKLIESLEGLRSDKDNLEGIIETEKNRLRIMLGDNEFGSTGRYKVSWSNQEKKGYTVKSYKSRVLRYSKIKSEKGE